MTASEPIVRVVDSPAPGQMEAAYALRRRVFCDEQKVPLNLERDGLDDAARHVIVFAGADVVATGRVLQDREPAKVQRVAVEGSRRGRGYGRIVMDGLEALAKSAGRQTVALSSQSHAVPFYLRLGYVPQGDEYLEAGIPHLYMEKPLR